MWRNVSIARWVAGFTLWLLFPQGESLLPTHSEAGWTPDPVMVEKRNISCLCQESDQISYSVVTHCDIQVNRGKGEVKHYTLQWCTIYIYYVTISTVKPTRCTKVLDLFYFGMTLHMFQTVFLSIVRSSRPHTATGICQTYCSLPASGYEVELPLASRQQYLFDICLLLYVQSWTPDDGRKDCLKHVECHSKIK